MSRSAIFQGDRILFELSAEAGPTFHCATPSVEQFRAIATGARVGARFRESRAIPRDARMTRDPEADRDRSPP